MALQPVHGGIAAPEVEPFQSSRPRAKRPAQPVLIQYVRNRYPPLARQGVPTGQAAADFVHEIVGRLASYGGDPDAMSKHPWIEEEDLLAEVALGVPAARDALIEIAQLDKGRERRIAIILLGRLPDAKSLEYLMQEGLRSPECEVRLAAVQALAQDQGWNVTHGGRREWGPAQPMTDAIASPEIVHALLELTRRESDHAVLSEAITRLHHDFSEGDVGVNDIDGQPSGMDSEDAKAHPQGFHFAADVLTAFRELYGRSQDEDVREQILDEVTRAHSTEAGQFLLECARTGRTPGDRAGALMSLAYGTWDGVDTLPVALGALEDTSSQVVDCAVQALRVAHRDEAVYDRIMHVMHTQEVEGGTRSIGLRATAWNAAVENLLSDEDRFGQAAPRDVDRALAMVRDGVRDTHATLALRARERLKELRSIASNPKERLTPEQRQAIERLATEVLGQPTPRK